MKIHELLSDESKWTTGRNARDAEGKTISPFSPEAARWSLLSALEKCYLLDQACGQQVLRKIKNRIGCESVTAWNDAPERTFAEVRQVALELDV